MDPEEGVYTGAVRPRQIPADWSGEPLPDDLGWRWYNPRNRRDSVRLYRGDPASRDASTRQPYVVVTVNGELLGPDGKPLGQYLDD